MSDTSCCCSSSGEAKLAPLESIKANPAEVRETTSKLSWRDRFGFFRARWGIGRMKYAVRPGLYRIGNPDANSPVFVTANYKMTFDLVRKELGETRAWILVLNTHGINVWCAAGKGTFSTNELIQQIESADLKTIVTHREIILPQLGAPGVAAHEVRKRTGFKVTYGPVYAKDIPAFLANGNRATAEMRQVRFNLKDRTALIPMELIPSLKWLPAVVVLVLIMRFADGSGIGGGMAGDLFSYVGAMIVGTTLFQVLLPWIPGRSFGIKGWLLGTAWTLFIVLQLHLSVRTAASNFLVLPMLTAYLALNFTGSTTFTSFSGVQRELRVAIPVMIASASAGILLRLASPLWI